MPPASGRSRLRLNAIANVLGRAVSMVLWIGVTPHVLRLLGQERFAVWSLFFVLNGYVLSIDLGSGAGASRFVAVAAARRDRAEARLVVLRSLALGAVVGVLWGLVCWLGRGWFIDLFNVPPAWALEVQSSLAVYGLSLLLIALSQSLLWALAGFQRWDLFNVHTLVGLGAHIGLLVLLVGRGGGLVGAAWAATAGHGISTLLAALSVRAELAKLQEVQGARGFSWRDLLRYSAVVQAAGFLGTAQFQAGKVMLGIIGRLVWVTTFELAFRVTNALWSLSTLIQNTVVTAAAHTFETEGLEGTQRLYEWCCRWVILVAGFVLGLVGANAPALFMLWLGSPQPEVAAAARWIAVGLGLSTLTGPATAVARGLGAPWLEALNFAVALTVNVLAGLWLIPRLGAQGAAIAMAVSFVMATAILLPLFHRRLGVSTAAWIARIAVPRLVPAATLATALGLLLDRWRLDSRAEALAAAAVGGLAFTGAYVAATWPTGDARGAMSRARAWLGRFANRAPAGD